MIVETLSRANVENVLDHYPDLVQDPENKVILISIGNPGQTTGEFDEGLFDDVLRLRFHDADPNADHKESKEMKLLDGEQVRNAIQFVNENGPDTLFVQCQAGQSRSCGMALAFNEHYNDGGMKDGWENYNRDVNEKMGEALRGFSKDSEYYNNLFS